MAQAFMEHTPAQGHLMHSQLIGKESIYFRSVAGSSMRAQTLRKSLSTGGLGDTRRSASRDVGDGSASTPSSPSGLGLRSKWNVGEKVRIEGIRRRADLNGLHGDIVQGVPDEYGRVCVQLQAKDGDPAKRKVIRVELAKLSPDQHHNGAFDGSRLGFPAFGVASVEKRVEPLPAPHWERHRGFRRKANGNYYNADQSEDL
mmetsp:Transcript_93657/g.303216  ORF Transcript_93657/g.303216 Transcript_93657/m.303216 type:complete len:201 (+) Transcript_93657:170-772(+)|eukprot:CAMPEP_0203842912 /NCGR_PEP_ID=MMETSP0359-20131031/2278_1 /ASSEMBLY_ACC=CAM_ASM_000338 /TAXON_ID=268821 /ORGANISM="Scrippsiella Hangoei, Strain SHTV-5" /LENGTH=200 /DNA_ID=CAMNT_0050757593 /DNA_START=123 /DNA_END=725 /DNA_ORIENTATION=+